MKRCGHAQNDEYEITIKFEITEMIGNEFANLT